MQHVLRAISGPHAGAVYVLGSRTTIGRASDCDIQILHDGVSRHHAKLTLEDDDTVVVADLSSDNGTFVEEERIERHVLAVGQVIRVMRSSFAYERLPADEARTSATFRRKVTSGDSLRQTVHHERSPGAVRAGLAPGGLPGSAMGERGRPHSRPQAAAPALSGARPGAAAGRGPLGDAAAPERSATADEPGAEDATEAADGPAWTRGPTPAHGVEVGAGAREPRPARAAADARSRPARTVTRPPLAVRAEEGRPGETTPSLAAAPGSDARGVRRPSPRTATPSPGSRQVARGRRARVPVGAASPVPPSPGASSAGVERPTASLPSSGPSGRMAPLAHGAVEHESDPPASGAAQAGAPIPAVQGTAPLGSGWIRVPRPLDAPGSMRPGATLTGVPPIDDAASRPGRTASSAPPERPSRRGSTAEYGAVGERQATERGLAVPPVAAPASAASGAAPSIAVAPASGAAPPASAPASTASGAAPPASVAQPGPRTDELDAMKTLPALRRSSRHRSEAASSDDDREPTAWRGSSTPTEEVPRVRADRPAAAGNPELAQRSVGSGGERTRGRSTVAYEDTLRYQRPERRTAAAAATPAPPPDVPQPRPHATSAELISALEALLPPDDAVAPPSTEQRPDAVTHALGPDASGTVDALLQAAALDDAWPSDLAGLSDVDKVELRARQVLEHADREHKRREGLERLVDVLEYRQLRVRALRAQGQDARAAERRAALERVLEPHAPADGDTVAMRRYHRFVCSIPAQLTHRARGSSTTATVEIEDLSAGGARITFGEFSIGAGETVWLTIDLARADRSRLPSPEASQVVLKARVVWSQPHEAKLGLVFAGAPDYR